MAAQRSHVSKQDRVVRSWTEEDPSRAPAPLHVVDLGDASAGTVRDLKKGRGELIDDVTDAIEQVETLLGDEAGGKVILPLVVVVEKKKRAEATAMFPFSLLPIR